MEKYVTLGLMKAHQPTSFFPFSAHSQPKSIINFYLHVKLSIVFTCMSPTCMLLLIAIKSNMQVGDSITSLECSKDAGILDRIRGLEVADLEGHLHG